MINDVAASGDEPGAAFFKLTLYVEFTRKRSQDLQSYDSMVYTKAWKEAPYDLLCRRR